MKNIGAASSMAIVALFALSANICVAADHSKTEPNVEKAQMEEQKAMDDKMSGEKVESEIAEKRETADKADPKGDDGRKQVQSE